MFGLIHRGELPQVTESEFENLVARLKALWLVEHNEDGSHIDSTGFITGAGTAGKITKFITDTEIGNSIMSEVGATILLTGGLTASGTVVAANFSGNGSGLTSLPASQLVGTTGAALTVALNVSTMSGDLPDVNLSANVPLLNFSTSLDWTNCNTIVLAPGTDVISNAVNSMQNGDVIILGAGTYTQTVAINIPTTVTKFAILGAGPDLTTIVFSNDTNGIASDMTNDAYRIVVARIKGFSMIYNHTVNGALTGILLWGAPYDSFDHGSILISEVAQKYGGSNKFFAVGIQLVDCRASYIQNCYIRTSSSVRTQTCIILHSCMNVRIASCMFIGCDVGIQLVKAADSLIRDATTKHGCEDIHIINSTFYIFNTGLVLGYRCLATKVHNVEFARPATGYGIFEDTSSGIDAGGYHMIDNCYFDNDANHDTAYAFIYLNRPGSHIRGSHFIDGSTLGANGINGIVLDATGTLTDVSNNIFRNFGRGGATGCYSNSNDNKISGNMFESTNAAGFDISIGASANRNVVAFNSIDQSIANSGVGTVLVTNTVH